jgi:hypothetical protein
MSGVAEFTGLEGPLFGYRSNPNVRPFLALLEYTRLRTSCGAPIPPKFARILFGWLVCWRRGGQRDRFGYLVLSGLKRIPLVAYWLGADY